MTKRDLKPDINGVAWQPSSTDMFKRVPAQEIGDMYYAYFNDFRTSWSTIISRLWTETAM